MKTWSLEAARINARMTQREAAKALNIAPLTLARYEKGDRVPNVDMAFRICKLYDCPFDALFAPKESI